MWWLDFIAPHGARVRKSAGTCDEQEARELHDKLKAESWRVARLGEKPNYQWEDAVVQWLKEKSHKASVEKHREIFVWVDRFLRGKALHAIDRALLFRIADAKAEESSQATANRYMALVRAVLRRACEVWEWTERVPKVPMFAVESKRTRWITREEAERVLAELPAHQSEMMRFTLATGLRQRNVCRLKWEHVDLERKQLVIPAAMSKTKKPIPVPLNGDAMAVQRQVGRHAEFVFVYEGEPVWQVSTKAWRKALKRAGVEDFRWHDLRHTWASWHVQEGTPLHAVQELGGWKSYEMVLRYSHLSTTHLRAHAERIESVKHGPVPPVPAVMARFRHSDGKSNVVPFRKVLK